MRIDQNTSYPVLQVRSRSLVLYQEYVFERSYRQRLKLSAHLKEIREKYKAYSGTMTAGAKKRLTKAVSLLVQSSQDRIIYNEVSRSHHQFKLSFLTLTIPLNKIRPDAKFCNKFLLEPMIRVLRRRYGLKSYIWKLELQRNGMVHYHLTTNLFINHTHLRNEWNNILRRNDLLEESFERTGNHDPNSTDIKSVRKVKDFEAYLVKYVTKDVTSAGAVNGKIWDCSLNLKKAEYFKLHGDWKYLERLEDLEKKKMIEVYRGDRFTLFKFRNHCVKSFMDKEDLNYYKLHVKQIGNGKIEKQKDRFTNLRNQVEREIRDRVEREKQVLHKVDARSDKSSSELGKKRKNEGQYSIFGNIQTLPRGFPERESFSRDISLN